MLLSIQPFAQQADTVYKLPAIEVVGGRVASVSAGSHVQVMDSATLRLYSTTNLARLLDGQASVIIRSYGPGGSASLSSRGLQATQSVVTWEGINLSSPTLGSTDLSMMPVFAFDNISMHYGGGSAIAGSGALGGTLSLSANDCFKQPLSMRMQVTGGSFGNLSSAFRMTAGNETLSYSLMVAANRSENNFKYTDLNGRKVNLKNAAYNSINAMQRIGWKISAGQLITLSGWYQASGRDIPATLVMTQSDQHQDDKALRLSLQYRWLKINSMFTSGVAFVHEYMHYTDATSHTDAVYITETYSSNIGYKAELIKRTIVDAGITGRVLVADVPSYDGTKSRSEMALYVALIRKFPLINWESVINFRQDLVAGYKVPFCPSMGAEGRIKGKLGGRVNLSRNFRVPTLNDRFWQPGGNPDLDPESSYNMEAGLTYKVGDTQQYFSGEFCLQAYSAWIRDMILWVPSTTSVWSPQNIEKLWSRGVEASPMLKYVKGKWNSRVNLNYTWSPSTFTGSETTDGSNGNQLIYIPLHTVKGSLRIEYGKSMFQVSGVAESRRFTRKDNGEWLPAFGLLSLSCGRSLNIRNTKLTFKFDISNLLNTSYQAVKYYPAPGISFLGSLIAEL